MKSGAFKIAILYTLAGILWITLSDRILLAMQKHFDLGFVLLLSSIKGVSYVLITGVLLYKLIHLFTKRLTESEQQYRSYFDDNPIPMWIIRRRTMLFTAVNDAAVACYGYSREEFMQMSALDLLLPDKINATISAFRELTTGINDIGIWQHRHKDGTIINVEISLQVPKSGTEQILVTARQLPNSKG